MGPAMEFPNAVDGEHGLSFSVMIGRRRAKTQGHPMSVSFTTCRLLRSNQPRCASRRSCVNADHRGRHACFTLPMYAHSAERASNTLHSLKITGVARLNVL